MSEKQSYQDPRKSQEIARRLADDLSQLDAQALPASTADDEMLSLIVDEASKGVDISKRYPTFYRKLLSNPDLRQAFLNALETLDAEHENRLDPLPESSRHDLTFLSQRTREPILEKFSKTNWRVRWEQTVEQLQMMFSPSQLAYRNDPSLFEDRWFMLLRGEIVVEGLRYSFDLDSAIAESGAEALTTFLNLAVTLEVGGPPSPFPIRAILEWGAYKESVLISQEGRARFPDIPLVSILDNELKTVKSELNLSLETVQ
jgi:hypothetical protein